MAETTNNANNEFSHPNGKHRARNTLIIVGVILVAFGIGGSLIASQGIKKFFWEARTKSEIKTVIELYRDLNETDIVHWQERDAQSRIETFGLKIKQYLPSVAALKIFTPDGTIAWTDLRNIEPGYHEPGIEAEINEVAAAEQMIKGASEATKRELDKADLREVWTVIKNAQGEPIGFIELYFDSTDITTFIKKIQYYIWGTITFVLVIIIVLLRLTFRKQDDLIVHQAHELSNVIEKTPIGIYIINQKGTITTINKKMLELLDEKDARKIIGQDIFTLSSVQKLNIEGLIHEALLGTPFKKETTCTTDNGNKLCQYYQATPLFDSEEKSVEQVLLTVEDITNQKKLEIDLVSEAKGLESLVTERTKNLEEKIAELEQFQRVTVDREIRMAELKQQIEKMRIKLEKLGATAETA